MKKVKYFGLEENVWEMGSCNGEVIKKLWSTIWHRLYPYICTEIDGNIICFMEKSQKGQISWRT